MYMSMKRFRRILFDWWMRRDSQILDLGLDELDALEQFAAFQAPRRHRQHPRLQVDCQHLSFRADQPRQTFGVETCAAPYVKRSHSRMHVRTEDRFGIVKNPTNRVVEATDEPPRANMSHGAILAHLRQFFGRNDFGIGTDSIAAKISLEDEVEIKLLIVTFQ